jgi:phage terminase Nu1 subunit (DNA packaging protein)
LTPPDQSQKPAQPLSQRAFAKLAGVSVEAVNQAIRAGRLSKSLTYDADGIAKIADPELALEEWARNTDLSRAPDAVKARAASLGILPPGDGGDGPAAALAVASAREKRARAELAELKAAKEAGRLVVAADVEAGLVDMVTTCRARLLAIPSKAKLVIPHLTIDDIAALEQLVRESLEDLAAGSIFG